ncbi:DUF2213 domain-containing protein [Agrobacterium vitis]|uniref:DUF2213 domain-containing protein n=1 Tax=Agrobacterium vitis TaxID=373 RepID=A0A6L6VAM5_AGRVI|nr:DUF2213 domain-containing protein [Agrobacterium vitis]
MHLQDKLTIDGTRRTRDGYLTVNARVAKADNVQTYLGSEVGRPELDAVRVFRPAEEVFSADTMQSFAHRPLTLGHPSSSVTATNWKDVAKGWSDGEVARDGDFTGQRPRLIGLNSNTQARTLLGSLSRRRSISSAALPIPSTSSLTTLDQEKVTSSNSIRRFRISPIPTHPTKRCSVSQPHCLAIARLQRRQQRLKTN